MPSVSQNQKQMNFINKIAIGFAIIAGIYFVAEEVPESFKVLLSEDVASNSEYNNLSNKETADAIEKEITQETQ